MRTLEARIHDLEDRLAIRELTARYNHAFDAQDAEAFADTYVEDGQTLHEEPGRSHGGRDAFIASCRRYRGRIVHTTSDAVIELDGDRATQLCTMAIFFRATDRTRNEFVLTG